MPANRGANRGAIQVGHRSLRPNRCAIEVPSKSVIARCVPEIGPFTS